MRAFLAGSVSTTKCQAWLLPGFEARVAAKISSRTSSSGTGSRFRNRIARQVAIASSTSIGCAPPSRYALDPPSTTRIAPFT